MSKEEIARNLYKYFEIANICEITSVLNKLYNQYQANINIMIMTSNESIGELLLHVATRNDSANVLNHIIYTTRFVKDIINMRIRPATLPLATLKGTLM